MAESLHKRAKSIVVDSDGRVVIIDSRSGERKRVLAPLGREPLASPDGEKIVYGNGSQNGLEIWLVHRDGSGRHRLTDNHKLDEWPSWAPGSKRLVVSRYNENQYPDADLFVVKADGSKERKITNSDNEEDCADWAPDGERIAFTDQEKGRIYSITPNRAKKKKITFGKGEDLGPSWSPNSRSVLFTKSLAHGEDLYKVRRNGTELTRLTHTRTVKPLYGWSPDGERIAYVNISAVGSTSLWAMRPNGSRKTKLADDIGSNFGTSPTWFRGHGKIAYARESPDNPGNRDIWIATADGLNNYALTDTPKVDELSPDWRWSLQECREAY